jgi:hypothetical protein
MRREESSFCVLRLKNLTALTLLAAVPALLLGASGAWADGATTQGPVVQLFTIPVPVASTNKTGGMYGFDISFVNQTTQTYTLSDRSNAAVDVVNAKTGKFVKFITATPPFAGATGNNNTSGPNGNASEGNCLFAGDGPSRVLSFLMPSGSQVTSIATGGTERADEMAFDPKDSILLVVNDADSPPFATLFNVTSGCALTIRSKITYSFATNGAEQTAWEPTTQRFYASIPSISGTTTNPGNIGAVIRINPLTATIEAMYKVPYCQPAGLSLGPNQTFLAGCSVVYDTAKVPWFGADTNSAAPVQVIIDTKGVYSYVDGIGSSDEVWYNSGDNDWYTGTSNSPYSSHPVASTSGATSTTDEGAAVLGVVGGTSQALEQIVPTLNVPATSTHVSGSSHSVAANSANSWVFVPIPANNAISGCLTGCIAVYGRK